MFLGDKNLKRGDNIINLWDQGAMTAYQCKRKTNKQISTGRTVSSKHHMLGAEELSDGLVAIVLRKWSHRSVGAE
jgi:hypothetical protein